MNGEEVAVGGDLGNKCIIDLISLAGLIGVPDLHCAMKR